MKWVVQINLRKEERKNKQRNRYWRYIEALTIHHHNHWKDLNEMNPMTTIKVTNSDSLVPHVSSKDGGGLACFWRQMWPIIFIIDDFLYVVWFISSKYFLWYWWCRNWSCDVPLWSFSPFFLCFDLSSPFSNYNEEIRHIKNKKKTLKIHQNSNYNIIDDINFFWQDESNISNKDHQRWWLKWVTFIVKGKWVICHLLVANVANVAYMGHCLVTFLSVIVFVLLNFFCWYWLCCN
jgi:hypothetical protein